MKNDLSSYYPAALTVAGSDSGGGAGIQVDLRTFNALGVYGTSVITAVTAQNPFEVRGVEAVSAEMVSLQLASVLDRIKVKYAKSGMLLNGGIVEAVADAVRRYRVNLVCDPVAVSTSGRPLLEDSGAEMLKRKLLPAAAWFTPNLPECELLTGRKITNWQEACDAARCCYDLWGVSVLLKTGHAGFTGKRAADVVVHKGKVYELSSPRITISGVVGHGTGCTLSAAMTAGFALGFEWQEVLHEAKAFLFGSLREGVLIGEDTGAMYPPVEDSYDEVTLKAVKGC